MPPQVLDRRKLVRALGALAGAAGAQSACSPPGPRLASKAEVQYQDTPKSISSCATCSFFAAPDACKVVAGKVSADGWCKLYNQVD